MRATSAYVLSLEQVNGGQVDTAGGKGASLGELIQAGFAVPKGFVVMRSAFDAFLAGIDGGSGLAGLLPQLGQPEIEVQPLVEKIASIVEQGSMPDAVADEIFAAYHELKLNYVAVRSSSTTEDGANTAWAGQLETYLNVSEDTLLDKVRACWLSAFSHRSLSYAAAHQADGSGVGVAVVIQEMVPSSLSGIGFSVHPVTQQHNIHLIEACFGLGEAIVSGQVSPDLFLVERDSGRLTEHTIGQQKKALILDPGMPEPEWRELGDLGAKPKLTDDQAQEYAGILQRIEA
ncbi:MAG: PEP/pyruvate-binding domain-containing protein, partial [Verrucomicrobiota bacterium]